MIVHTKHTTFRFKQWEPPCSGQFFSFPLKAREAVGTELYSPRLFYATAGPNFFQRYWNQRFIRFFLTVPTYFGSFTFLAIRYETRWAALLPTASNQPQIFKGSTGQ